MTNKDEMPDVIYVSNDGWFEQEPDLPDYVTTKYHSDTSVKQQIEELKQNSISNQMSVKLLKKTRDELENKHQLEYKKSMENMQQNFDETHNLILKVQKERIDKALQDQQLELSDIFDKNIDKFNSEWERDSQAAIDKAVNEVLDEVLSILGNETLAMGAISYAKNAIRKINSIKSKRGGVCQ